MPSLHAVELRRVSAFPALSVAVLFVMVLAGDHMVEGTEDGWVQTTCRNTSWLRSYESTSGQRGPYVPIDKSLKPISCYSLLIFKRASREHLVMRENMSDGLWSSVWSPAKHMLTLEQGGSERLEAEAKLDFIAR